MQVVAFLKDFLIYKKIVTLCKNKLTIDISTKLEYTLNRRKEE